MRNYLKTSKGREIATEKIEANIRVRVIHHLKPPQNKGGYTVDWL